MNSSSRALSDGDNFEFVAVLSESEKSKIGSLKRKFGSNIVRRDLIQKRRAYLDSALNSASDDITFIPCSLKRDELFHMSERVVGAI